MIKIILSFLILLLVVMGIPSAIRLSREAGMNIKRLTYVVGCSIIAAVVLTVFVILF